jgi:hypothetical protein
MTIPNRRESRIAPVVNQEEAMRIGAVLVAAMMIVTFAGSRRALAAQPLPVSGTWTPAGHLQMARSGHAAAQLNDGRVLVAGGLHNKQVIASAELFDPKSGTWMKTGSLHRARAATSAVLLDDGRVLLAGGCVKSCNTPTATAELYDPISDTWTTTGSMKTARYFHTSVVLNDGRVLVAGGCAASDCSSISATAEIYDPVTATWSETGSLHDARELQTATVLPGGDVLVAGGLGSAKILASSEIYHPATGQWSAAAIMQMARKFHAATLLPDGTVLATGGRGGPFGAILCSAEIFDPVANTWALTGTMKKMVERHTATLLQSGEVLAAGGDYSKVVDGQVVPMQRAESKVYSTANARWTITGSLHHARTAHTATLLGDGRLLVVGGTARKGDLATAELYQP